MMTFTPPPADSPANVSPALAQWRPRKPLILTGYMGAGKSTIARCLGQTLGWPYFDTDREVVKRAHMSIPKVFEQFGEAYFRQLEAEALTHCTQASLCVLATGGGTLTHQEAVELAKASAWVVYLCAPPAYLFERVIFSPKERPLLDVPNAEEAFHQRFKLREPFYQQAHVTVHTPAKKPQQVAADVLEALFHFEASHQTSITP